MVALIVQPVTASPMYLQFTSLISLTVYTVRSQCTVRALKAYSAMHNAVRDFTAYSARAPCTVERFYIVLCTDNVHLQCALHMQFAPGRGPIVYTARAHYTCECPYSVH